MTKARLMTSGGRLVTDDPTRDHSDDADEDVPTALTRLLRNVPGVHTVYATQPLVPTVVTAVVELVRNEPVGVHLVTVVDGDEGVEIIACVGIDGDEPAPVVSRRVHDALRSFFTDQGLPAPRSIRVNVGRVG